MHTDEKGYCHSAAGHNFQDAPKLIKKNIPQFVFNFEVCFCFRVEGLLCQKFLLLIFQLVR